MSQHKTLRCLSFLLFLYTTSFSQKASTCYVDSSLKLLDKGNDNYAYKCKLVKKDSVFNLQCFDRETKNLRVEALFSDSLLTDLHGDYTSYDADGATEAKRHYTHGLKTGVWEQWNKDGNKTDSAYYINNQRTAFARYGYHQFPGAKPVLAFHQFTDSLKNTFQQQLYEPGGALMSDANFIGETGIEKTYENGKQTIDTVYTREQTAAEFVGGVRSWARYVQRSLEDFNAKAMGAGTGTYKVIIRFQISTTGTITDVVPETNYGYGFEAKAMQVVQNGPSWTPAMRFGRPARAYRRQPVTFVVEGK